MKQQGLRKIGTPCLERETDRGAIHRPLAALSGGSAEQVGFLIERHGIRCAGLHLIIDLYGASRLDDIDYVERTLVDCVQAAGATLLHTYLHPFESNGGVSGVAVLSESHISIHTWPEYCYAAIDVFMCGKAQPYKCVEVLRGAFRPRQLTVEEMRRGTEL